MNHTTTHRPRFCNVLACLGVFIAFIVICTPNPLALQVAATVIALATFVNGVHRDHRFFEASVAEALR